jgi:hypothetical protein
MTLSTPLFCTVPADVWATYKVSVEPVAYAVLLRATEQQMESAAIKDAAARCNNIKDPFYSIGKKRANSGMKPRQRKTGAPAFDLKAWRTF